MEYEELKQTLHDLHQQLQNGAPVDPQLAELIQQLSRDVSQVAASGEIPAAASTPADLEKETLLDRMLSLTQEFEETHPKLAEAIGRVATAFSRIGI